MKICQESFASLYLFKSKFYSNYPGFINFGGSVEYHYDIGAGLSFGYHHDATGSKSSYKDYSGEFSDIYQLASNNFTFGLIFDSKIVGVEIKKYKLYFITDIGFKTSSLKKEEYWKFLKDDTLKIGNYSSVSGILEPQLRISYPYKKYEFGLSVGYHVDFGGRYNNDSKLAQNSSKEEFLNDPVNYRIVSSEWSGIRLKANLTIYILQLFERPDRTEWD
jgi:hypothetical protein